MTGYAGLKEDSGFNVAGTVAAATGRPRAAATVTAKPTASVSIYWPFIAYSLARLSSGIHNGRPYNPPSLARTSSFTRLPSTVFPASLAIAAFITFPVSLELVAPVSARAAITAASNSWSLAAAGR